MNKTPSPRQLAEEARQALASAPMSPHEHFEFLVQQGIIDRSGRVLVARLFGEDHDEETPVPQEPTADPDRNGA